MLLSCGVAVAQKKETPISSNAQTALRVWVSIPPLAGLLRAVLPVGSSVDVFLPAGQSPEVFEPTPRTMSRLSRATHFVASGLAFEKVWLPRMEKNFPQMKVIWPFGPPKAKDHEAHHKNHHHEDHDHPHPWLTPKNLRRILDAVQQEMKLGEAVSREKERLEQLSRRVAELLKPHQGKKFYTYHPAWQEFAAQFGLVQVALEDRGHSPGPQALASFLNGFSSSGSKRIFIQPQDNRQNLDRLFSQLLQKKGVDFIVVDPLAEDIQAELLKFSQLLRADLDNRL